MPLESYDGVVCTEYQPVYAYSEQVTKDVIRAGGASRASAHKAQDPESCNPEGRQVVSGEPVGYQNLLVRDNATGAYQLVNVPPPGVTPADALFQAASADLSHVIFTETSPLAEGARYGVENLYEWDEGALRLVSWLPNGTAVPGSLPAVAGTVRTRKCGLQRRLACPLHLRRRSLRPHRRAAHCPGRRLQVWEPGGGGSFKAATADGSKVFFLDGGRLTEDSTAVSADCAKVQKVDDTRPVRVRAPRRREQMRIDGPHGRCGGLSADVLRVMPLGGHDSSDVYFVAEGVLASNTREITNGEGKTVVEGAEAGKENLSVERRRDHVHRHPGVEYSRLGIEQTSPNGKWLALNRRRA